MDILNSNILLNFCDSPSLWDLTMAPGIGPGVLDCPTSQVIVPREGLHPGPIY